MHTVTWGRTRANLRALKQKMGSPLEGAIFDGNHQYWYQINQWIILHALVGVAKQYRKYFRFRAKNHFSIFHPYLKSHLRSKIARISWKFGQLCKMSQIIIIYEKKIFKKFSTYAKRFFRFKGLFAIGFLWNSTGTSKIWQRK